MANFDYENQYWWSGKEVVAGIDEAGRGPIAGPLVIGICVFPPFYDNYEINDSKQLTDRKRRKMLEIIKRDAVYYSYEVISVEEVDQYNIYAATQLGMERAVKRMQLNVGDSVGGIYKTGTGDDAKWELVEDKINKITITKKAGTMKRINMNVLLNE